MTPNEMIGRANELAQERKGLDGIYFVLVDHQVGNHNEMNNAHTSGFDALTAYLYTPDRAGYDNLSWRYWRQWNRNLVHSGAPLPYFLPMTSGWNDSPWPWSSVGGICSPTPDEFENHLRDGYAIISENMEKTKGIGMIGSWNEFGEGHFVEPTKKWEFQFLERIMSVFGNAIVAESQHTAEFADWKTSFLISGIMSKIPMRLISADLARTENTSRFRTIIPVRCLEF